MNNANDRIYTGYVNDLGEERTTFEWCDQQGLITENFYEFSVFTM